MEWAEFQSSVCGGCGHLLSECRDPKNSEEYEAVPLQCFACAAKDAELRHARDASSSGNYGSGSFDGLQIVVTKKGVVDG